MLTFKHILCPVDFSEPSALALTTAADLVAMFDGALTVLHVIPPIPLAAVPSEKSLPALAEYQRTLDESYAKKLADLIDSRISEGLRRRPGAVRQQLLHGEAAFEIIRHGRAHHADLIVIATHGRTGWEHLVFGSVTEKVVRHSPCPVLTIRPGAK